MAIRYLMLTTTSLLPLQIPSLRGMAVQKVGLFLCCTYSFFSAPVWFLHKLQSLQALYLVHCMPSTGFNPFKSLSVPVWFIHRPQPSQEAYLLRQGLSPSKSCLQQCPPDVYSISPLSLAAGILFQVFMSRSTTCSSDWLMFWCAVDCFHKFQSQLLLTICEVLRPEHRLWTKLDL